MYIYIDINIYISFSSSYNIIFKSLRVTSVTLRFPVKLDILDYNHLFEHLEMQLFTLKVRISCCEMEIVK